MGGWGPFSGPSSLDCGVGRALAARPQSMRLSCLSQYSGRRGLQEPFLAGLRPPNTQRLLCAVECLKERELTNGKKRMWQQSFPCDLRNDPSMLQRVDVRSHLISLTLRQETFGPGNDSCLVRSDLMYRFPFRPGHVVCYTYMPLSHAREQEGGTAPAWDQMPALVRAHPGSTDCQAHQ